ncbi:MAG: NAD-dependent epimerase/dehydratase family protein [Capsulimonadaceae bacterium]
MKYFVTGATGFIGGRLVRKLVASGNKVVALVRRPAEFVHLTALGIKLAPGDVTDPDSVARAMEGCDAVFHLAAWYRLGARDRKPAQDVNVDGTRNVLTAMRDLRVTRGVYTSTLAVYGDTQGRVVDETYRHDRPWLSEYDRTKWAAHYQVALPLMAEGLPLIIVQPGLTYGPGDTSSVHLTLRQYLAGKLPMTPARTAFCWGHVDDTVDGHLLAMECGRPGETYIIAGPVHTLVGAFDLAERITGIPAPRSHPSPTTLRSLSTFMRAVEAFAPVPEQYSAESLRVLAGSTYLGSSAKAERELGFTARPLDEGLGETLRYEQSIPDVSRPKS